MCGIIGNFGKIDEATKRSLGFLRHRGPDASGEWTSPDGLCWLGHRRLSILELSDAGAQPMVSASGRFVIVFNGEIYNHLELRKQLELLSWRGHSDTETLLEAWEELGESCLEHLRGMFAFAIFDRASSSLHLVRDRLGIKPLYFRREAVTSLSFASEVRALLQGRRPTLTSEALVCYLATGHTPARGEIGEGVEILPPGSLLRVDRNGDISRSTWWRCAQKSPHPAPESLDQVQAGVRSHIEAAVAEHLLADVPVAAFLSGGIDSSIISLVAARHLGSSLRTFCIGFPHAGFDERSVARLVAERMGSQHTEIEVGPTDCQQWAVEAVAAMDLPSADAINTYIVSKAVRQAGIQVALSGLGGDELFGGYPSFSDIPRLGFLQKMPPPLARAMVRFLPSGVRQKLDGATAFDPFTLALLRRRWWSGAALKSAGLKASVPWPVREEVFLDNMQAISAAEILGYMEPMLLRDSDQMSMAVSLELRVPLLDHRLVEFILSLPEKWKRGRPPKRLLIDSFADILPNEVWNRPKQGFALPMDDWMRGPLQEFCRHGVDAARARLDARFVDSAVFAFQEKKLHWTRLWQIAVLGHYSERST